MPGPPLSARSPHRRFAAEGLLTSTKLPRTRVTGAVRYRTWGLRSGGSWDQLPRPPSERLCRSIPRDERISRTCIRCDGHSPPRPVVARARRPRFPTSAAPPQRSRYPPGSPENQLPYARDAGRMPTWPAGGRNILAGCRDTVALRRRGGRRKAEVQPTAGHRHTRGPSGAARWEGRLPSAEVRMDRLGGEALDQGGGTAAPPAQGAPGRSSTPAIGQLSSVRRATPSWPRVGQRQAPDVPEGDGPGDTHPGEGQVGAERCRR